LKKEKVEEYKEKERMKVEEEYKKFWEELIAYLP
jgi:hypothetical protein